MYSLQIYVYQPIAHKFICIHTHTIDSYFREEALIEQEAIAFGKRII